MISKNTPHVKNPLTIIAVFAGITEISGTSVIAFLETGQQEIFIWFLVLFPTLLIVLFFVTLNFNPKVLYAPSDFKNEENFLLVHKYDRSTQQSVTESVIVEPGNTIVSRDTSERQVNITGTTLSKVLVSNFANAKSFVSLLTKKNYLTKIYESSRDTSLFETHESIWVGKNIEPSEVIEVIKEAINFYPHFKYLHLSGDGGEDPPEYVHNQMYIGGATSAAKRYKVTAFSSEEVKSLSKQITKSELHKFIRKHYE
jgi:hypothetical protein